MQSLAPSKASFLVTASAWISRTGQVYPVPVMNHAYALWSNPEIQASIPWLKRAQELFVGYRNVGPDWRSGAEYAYRTAFSDTLDAKVVDALYALNYARLAPASYTAEAIVFELTGTEDAMRACNSTRMRLVEEYALSHGYLTANVTPLVYKPDLSVLAWDVDSWYLNLLRQNANKASL